MRKVLVTGGAGFIGSHVADAFLHRGDDVWVVDDLSSGNRDNIPERARFIELDIRDARLRDVFADAGGFEVISHHAAQIDVRLSVADPRRDASINIDGFLQLAELAREYGTRRFIFVSSGGVVYRDPGPRPTPEQAPKLPMSPYGVSKLAAEYYLYSYFAVHGLDYVALRYANVYGPRQSPHGEAGVVAIFCQRILDGVPLTVFGDGEQTRDYVFVGDVVSANLLAADVVIDRSGADLDSRAFNVGTGRETSVNSLCAALLRVAGRQVPIEHAPARLGELRHSCLDTGQLTARGWSCATPLDQGLEATFEFIAARR